MTTHHDRAHESGLSGSRDYEREAEQTRRRLAENLDELSDRLTPGQVFDEMLTYSRAGSGTFFRAFSNAMRENPLPSLLIGGGCMMFLSEKMGVRSQGFGNGGRPTAPAADEACADGAGRPDAAGRMTGAAGSSARAMASSVQSGIGGAAESASRQTANAVGAIADTMGQTAASVSDAVSNAADTMRAKAHDLRDQTGGAVEQARVGAQNVAGAVRDAAASMSGAVADTASSVSGGMADTAGRTRRRAADAVRRSRDSAASFVTEQPLLCAAIGVAVGAALAGLLPSTETEDRLMGDASDAVKGTAGQVGSEVVESAKNVASKVADRAQSAVKEEGLSPSAVADAARNLSEGIQSAQSGVKQPTTGTGPLEGASVQRQG